jgi:hypothetical protein
VNTAGERVDSRPDVLNVDRQRQSVALFCEPQKVRPEQTEVQVDGCRELLTFDPLAGASDTDSVWKVEV